MYVSPETRQGAVIAGLFLASVGQATESSLPLTGKDLLLSTEWVRSQHQAKFTSPSAQVPPCLLRILEQNRLPSNLGGRKIF